MKRKLLLFMAAALLCGAASAQNYWGTDPNSHAQPSNTPIVASVQIDGQDVTATDAMRLGAFVGNELRGIAAKHNDGNFWIQVFYTAQTDNITFKFYDGETEYTTCETTLNGSDEGYGTPNAPQVLNFTTAPTQQTQLASGWNWWSSYVEITDGVEALTNLENSLGTDGARIQSSEQGRVDYYTYNGGMWYGQLTSICNEQMYKVNTNAAHVSELNGTAAIPSNHPITINGSWNWIGFPYSQPVSVTVAMSGFNPNHLDQIKSLNDGYTTYYVNGSNAMWYGTLNTLIPGEGYMYKSNANESKTLTYQTSRGEALVENVSPKDNVFVPKEGFYAENMTITAVVELADYEVRDDSYEVAVFVGGECRGSVKLMYVEPIDRYVAFLLVSGDSEEIMSFALTDGRDISWSSDHLMYSTDAIIGDLSEPTVLHFGPLGINDNTESLVSVYPNPSIGVFNVEGDNIRKVEVINAFGQVIISKEVKVDNMQIDLSSFATGIYMLRTITDNGISIKQLIKK